MLDSGLSDCRYQLGVRDIGLSRHPQNEFGYRRRSLCSQRRGGLVSQRVPDDLPCDACHGPSSSTGLDRIVEQTEIHSCIISRELLFGSVATRGVTASVGPSSSNQIGTRTFAAMTRVQWFRKSDVQSGAAGDELPSLRVLV